MENILDEQLDENKQQQAPVPIVIYLFIIAVFIYLLGSLVRIQSWPYASQIQMVGTIAILITGVLSLGVFEKTKDRYLKFYSILFLFGGLSKIAGYYLWENYLTRTIVNFGTSIFLIAVLLTLIRYFILRRPRKTSSNIIRYPMLLTTPIWIIGFFFKMQSWPYASEMITISAFLFLLGTIVMLILKLRMEPPALRLITVWLVLMANILVFGLLFKIQSWPYASQLLTCSFVGGVLGIMIKLMQQQQLSKDVENKL